jgi:predicted transcriptional regulator
MKQKSTTTSLYAKLLLLSVVLAGSASATSSKMFREERRASSPRVLESFGGYTIEEGEISETCDNYEEEEIEYTEEELAEGNENLAKYFSFLKEAMKRYFEDEDKEELRKEIMKKAWMFINAIFAVVSLVAFIWFFILFACQCCFSILCCCCKDELEKDLADKPTDSPEKRRKKAMLRAKREKRIKQLNTKTCTWCMMITILILVCAITVLGIIWSIYIFKSIDGLERSDCASSKTINNIRFGVKKEDRVFIGIKGLDFLMEKSFDAISDFEQGTSIHTLGLDTEQQALTDSLQSFYDSHKDDSVASCSGIGTVQPQSIQTMTNQITDFIGVEYTELGKACNQIHDLGVTVNDIASGEAQNYKDRITEYRETLADQDKKILDAQNKYEDNVDTENIAKWARLGAWFGMVGTLGSMVFFVVIAIFSLNDCCSGLLIFLEGLLALIKMFFAFLLNVIAVAGLVGGVIVCNGCVLGYEALNDKELSANLFPDSVKEIMDACLYTDSSGDLKSILGGDLTQLENIEDVAEALAIDLDSLNITSTEPPSIQFYKTELLAKWKSYELPDYDESQVADSPDTQVSSGNNIVDCTNDEWQLNPSSCTRTPVSTITDSPETINQATDYCIVPSQFQFTTLNIRYDPGNCALLAAPIYANLKACVDDHDTLIGNLETDVDSGPRAQGVSAYTKLQNAKTEFEDLQTKGNDLVEFVKSTSENLDSMMDCRVMRAEVRNLMGNMCYKFAHNFTVQSILIGIIGPLMTILAFCVCCVYRKSKLADEIGDLKRAKKKGDKKAQKYRDSGHAPPLPPQQAGPGQMQMQPYPQQRGQMQQPYRPNQMNMNYR